jgi:glycosyltransferase involved in cell wall biosynthesis
MVSHEPVISVVVPTHNRAHLLKRLLQAIESQERVGSYEVLVVDDASSDNTWIELQRLAATARVCIVPLRLDRNSGPATARNVGWRAARAPLIAFTDDDCVPQPGWLAALVTGLAGADLVQGETQPVPEQNDGRGPFARIVLVEGEAGQYETCNMGYRREVLERIGGFDEAFRHPYAEDMDLAWRAKERGASSAFVPEALVYHEVFPSRYLSYLRDRKRRESVVLALRHHPGLRERLSHRWFWEPAHPPALLAGAGVGLALWRPLASRRVVLAALLVLPYAHHRTVARPLPCRRRNRVPVIALGLVADLAEVGVLAVASVKHRTLVL